MRTYPLVELWRGRDGRYGYTFRSGLGSNSGDCKDGFLRRRIEAWWAGEVLARFIRTDARKVDP